MFSLDWSPDPEKGLKVPCGLNILLFSKTEVPSSTCTLLSSHSERTEDQEQRPGTPGLLNSEMFEELGLTSHLGLISISANTQVLRINGKSPPS